MEPTLPAAAYGLKPEALGGFWTPDARALVTLAFVIVALALRWALVRLIRRQAEDLSETQLRWIAWIRNGGVAVVLLGGAALWAPEIEAFALSITAFVVAVVIATKEVIMCVSGGLLRSTSGAFQTGDWIEAGGRSGEVADHTLLSTTLWEFDAGRQEFTGRQVTLPNSVFLSAPVTNHGFRRRFVFHEFAIHWEPVPGAAEGGRAAILGALEAASEGFGPLAQRYSQMLEKRAGVRLPPAAPRVRLATTELAKLRFEATIFCPRDQAQAVEAAAVAAFLAWADAQPFRPAAVAPVA